MGSGAWWRLGQSPLYPDLLLETCHQLLGGGDQPGRSQCPKLQGRVLVADDHPINRALLARQLAILGVDAEVVDDGDKALRTWQGQAFALLLTDCHMPVMDGYSLTGPCGHRGVGSRHRGDYRYIRRGQPADAGSRHERHAVQTLYPGDAASDADALVAGEPSDPGAGPARSVGQRAGECWISLFGDEAVARSMAREYLDSNRQDGDDMMQALARQDTYALVETAHRIKGLPAWWGSRLWRRRRPGSKRRPASSSWTNLPS